MSASHPDRSWDRHASFCTRLMTAPRPDAPGLGKFPPNPGRPRRFRARPDAVVGGVGAKMGKYLPQQVNLNHTLTRSPSALYVADVQSLAETRVLVVYSRGEATGPSSSFFCGVVLRCWGRVRLCTAGGRSCGGVVMW